MDASTSQKVKELLAQGKSRDDIKKTLLADGVSADHVDDVLDILVPPPPAEPAPAARPVVSPQAVVHPDPATTAVSASETPQPQLQPEPKKARGFFRLLSKTVYSPETYAEVVAKPTGKMVAFFLKFALILLLISVVASISSFIKAGESITGKLPTTIDTALDVIPSTLQVHIVDGKVSTNAKEPVYIKASSSNSNKQFQNLVVIDTKTPFTAEQFQNYHTVAWLTKDSVIYYSQYDASPGASPQASNIQVAPLTDVKNVTLSKAYLQSLVNKYKPWLRFLLPLLGILGLIGLYLFHAGKLIYLFFPALVLLLGAKLMKVNIRYRQAYRVAIFASVPVFVLQTIFRDVVHTPWPTFTTTALILIVALVNLGKAKSFLVAPATH